jgi:hypothetical protein
MLVGRDLPRPTPKRYGEQVTHSIVHLLARNSEHEQQRFQSLGFTHSTNKFASWEHKVMSSLCIRRAVGVLQQPGRLSLDTVNEECGGCHLGTARAVHIRPPDDLAPHSPVWLRTYVQGAR